MKLIIFFGLLAMLMPGCIVWDIRDNLRVANAQLAETNANIHATRTEIAQVHGRLTGMNADLGNTNNKLGEANTKLLEVQSGLTRVDTTNGSLTTLDSQLTSMQSSLKSIDTHLAGLRTSLGAIDSLIPFVDLGTDTTPAQASVEPSAANDVAQPTPPGTQTGEERQSTTTPEKPAGTAPISPQPSIAGTWVSANSEPLAIVFQADGSYLWGIGRNVGNGLSLFDKGKWKLKGNAIEMASAIRETGSPNGDNPQPQPYVYTLTIVQQSARSMTLTKDDVLIVLRKP
jgi:hypothetical protein